MSFLSTLIATGVVSTGLSWAPTATAQEVLLNSAGVPNSPNVVDQVKVGEDGVLSVDKGASIIVSGDDAVVDHNNHKAMTVDNRGTIRSANKSAINASNATLEVNNSGVITGNNDGVRAGNGDIKSLVNSGSITGTHGDGVGAVHGDIKELINSGSITGADEGVIAKSGSIKKLNNSGDITGGEYGVFANDDIDFLDNSGKITAIGAQGDGDGVQARHGDIKFLKNTGDITGADDGVLAKNGDIKELINKGTIRGADVGVAAGDGIVSLTNSGFIIGNLKGFAIQEQGHADTVLTLLPGSNIQGLIDLGGGKNTLVVGNGLNLAASFDHAPDKIITNGAPFAVDKKKNLVAVVDPTGFAASDNAISDLVSSASASVNTRLNHTNCGQPIALSAHNIDGTDIAVTPVADLPRQYEDSGYEDAPYEAAGGCSSGGAWVKAFGGFNKLNGSGPSVDSEHVYGGLAVGVDGSVSRDLQVGVFGGIAAGQIEVDFNAQDIDTNSYFVGAYGRREGNGWWVDFTTTAGVSVYDSTRIVANNLVAGGLEEARGDYNGWFVAPEITFGSKIPVGGASIKPSLRARYVGMWFDDYSENGSAANLSVDDREVHTLEARFQLALPLIDNPGRSFELRAGVDGRFILGNDDVDATLLAQQVDFSPGGADESVDGFVGVSYVDQIASNTQLFVSGEAATGTEVEVSGSAQAGVRFSF